MIIYRKNNNKALIQKKEKSRQKKKRANAFKLCFLLMMFVVDYYREPSVPYKYKAYHYNPTKNSLIRIEVPQGLVIKRWHSQKEANYLALRQLFIFTSLFSIPFTIL